jgi:RHS repeat-associated protein
LDEGLPLVALSHDPEVVADSKAPKEVIGLYYFRNRYLDPVEGRFVNRDPIGIWGDPGNMGNGYAFEGGNPVSRRDPFGLGQEVTFENDEGVRETVSGNFVRETDDEVVIKPGTFLGEKHIKKKRIKNMKWVPDFARTDNPVTNIADVTKHADLPFVTNSLATLETNHWTVEYGHTGEGSSTDTTGHTVTLDPGTQNQDNPVMTTMTLAHELTHATTEINRAAGAYPPEPQAANFPVAMGGVYLTLYVQYNLTEEGWAVYHQFEARESLLQCGITVSGDGTQSEFFRAEYYTVWNGAGTPEEKAAAFGALYGSEVTSTTGETYVDFETRNAVNQWNFAHPESPFVVPGH